MSIPLVGVKPAKVIKIPRPMNAFMIFAREHRPKAKREHPAEANHVISVRLGKIWSGMSEEEKDHYQELSRQAVNEHRKKYPDYRYEPKPKIRKKRRYDQFLLMNRLRSETADTSKDKDHQAHPMRPPTAATSTLVNASGGKLTSGVRHPHWTFTSSAAAMPHPHTQAAQQVTYAPGSFYTQAPPNMIPAHGQPGRISGQLPGPSLVFPSSFPSHGGYPQPLPDVHHILQPLDMTTIHGSNAAYAQYKLKKASNSDKVYCDLTSGPVHSHPGGGTAAVPNLQDWTSKHITGFQSQWGHQTRVSYQPPPQTTAKNIVQNTQGHTTVNHRVALGTSSKTGDGSKTELVWIPCEPDFARKIGWPQDQSIQSFSNDNQ